MNSKITHIEFKNEWEGKHGIFYFHDIQFENGDKGQIGAKSKLPEKLQVGKSLDYEAIKDDKGNTKIKAIQLPPNIQRGFNPAENELRQRMIIAQSSLSSAVTFCSSSLPCSEEEVIKVAERFYNWVLTTSK
jgi:hypothetical protein